MARELRIGIDLGGTKIAAVALDAGGAVVAADRVPAPRGDYEATVRAVAELVRGIESRAGRQGSVGIGTPGSLSPHTGLMQNANSTWLNGRPLDRDLQAAVGREVRLANDANCFALSEAADGAAEGASLVFGVILGTGCGGGVVFEGRPLLGRHRIGGEWGHNPLPWPGEGEFPAPPCWCGRAGCIELWVSGSGLERDHSAVAGESLSAAAIVEAAAAGEAAARASLDRHAHRLARGLAHVTNILDPDVIVLGGGLSNMRHLYEALPALMDPYVAADTRRIDIRRPLHGDASGVRGAARLWDSP